MTPQDYRSQRTRRGLSQAAAAALLGVSRETISRRETGKDAITREAALAIRSLPEPARAKP